VRAIPRTIGAGTQRTKRAAHASPTPVRDVSPRVLDHRVARGRVAGGRFLEYDDVEHNRLLVSIAHAMGLPDVTTVGDLDVGEGPLAGVVA
jgi:hypothetical protein